MIVEELVEESSPPSPLNYSFNQRQTIARDELVLEHLPVVMSIANRFLTTLPPSVDVDDIRSAGILGLIDAAEKFDMTRSIRFRTYAEVRIKGAMLDYLRSLSWAPRRLHSQTRELNRVRTEVESAKGCRASATELADAMGRTLEQHHRLRREILALDIQNSDDLWMDEDGKCGSPPVADPAMNPAVELERQEMLEILRQAIEGLPERQKVLLWLYYHEELTMKEVGAVLKFSESRASQLHAKTLAALRLAVRKRLHPQASSLEGLPPVGRRARA